MEERQGLHVRKEHMVLQGQERDAILEVEIGCLFLSTRKGYKCPNRIIQRAWLYFSRKAWISSRVEAMLFVISSATSQNCCWFASMTSSDIVVSEIKDKGRSTSSSVTVDE